jgi:hypothetical protein
VIQVDIKLSTPEANQRSKSERKVVEAVKQHKFKPAMENGKPVLVELNVEVNFQTF